MVGIIPLLAVVVVDEEVLDRARRRVGKQFAGLLDAPRPRRLERLHASGLVRGEPGDAAAAARRRRRRAPAAAVRARCSTRTEFLSPYGLRAVSALPPRASLRARGRGDRGRRSTTSRPSRRPRCSAATPTGGGRSGSRSTTSWSSALERYAPLLRRRLHDRVPDRLGQRRCRSARSPTISGDRLISLFLVGADGAGRASAGSSGCRRDPAWKDNLVFNEYFHGDNGAGLGASPPDRAGPASSPT